MVSGLQAAERERVRTVEEAACLPGGGSEEERSPGPGYHQVHRSRAEICFSICVTERFSDSSGRKISLALGEPALWAVTDGDSWLGLPGATWRSSSGGQQELWSQIELSSDPGSMMGTWVSDFPSPSPGFLAGKMGTIIHSFEVVVRVHSKSAHKSQA